MITERGPVVLGVDIGTTAVKALALDGHGVQWGEHRVAYRLSHPSAGYSVQDPGEIVDAAWITMRRTVEQATDAGKDVAGVCFSAAMHALVGFNGHDRAITPVVTWADTRASAQAARLRAEPSAAALHRRTGTPVHAMSPLVKLHWFRDSEPHLFSRVAHWVGIKEFLVHKLTTTWVTDQSMASGTGLYNLSERRWDSLALDGAGIASEQLPELVSTRSQLRGRSHAMTELGLRADTPIVIGAGDGPLANLGVGAVEPGVAACSLGTSGAVRIVVSEPTIGDNSELFCYVLDDDRWVVGGAVSNGGLVFQWAHDTISSVGGNDEPVAAGSQFFRIAEEAPPACDGLVMLPYLVGERSPVGDAAAAGAFLGLRHTHRKQHLARATVEGVCQQLALVLEVIRANGHRVERVIATGGATKDPFIQQLLANVLGTPVSYLANQEGSAVGAALLAMSSLGLPHNVAEVVDSGMGSRVEPTEEAAIYSRIRPRLLATREALQALGPSS